MNDEPTHQNCPPDNVFLNLLNVDLIWLKSGLKSLLQQAIGYCQHHEKDQALEQAGGLEGGLYTNSRHTEHIGDERNVGIRERRRILARALSASTEAARRSQLAI